MIVRPSYLHNGISYTDKMTSLYWIQAQSVIIITIWSLVVKDVAASDHKFGSDHDYSHF